MEVKLAEEGSGAPVNGTKDGSGSIAEGSGGGAGRDVSTPDQSTASTTGTDALKTRVAGLQRFVERLFPGAVLEEWHGSLFKYAIPKRRSLADAGLTAATAQDRTGSTSLASIFGAVEAAKEELGIIEYSVSQTTLEQVFISIAKGQ
jgi:hypothetical protein